MAAAKGAKAATGHVSIKPPKMQTVEFHIRGNAPLVMHKFSAKAQEQIRETQAKGSTARKEKKRDPKDFKALYEGAMHRSRDGWYGIPASAFRNAMISACRLVSFKMTLAKLSVFVEADGFEPDTRTPLVRITSGEPEQFESMVRNASGVCDLRVRPLWDAWEAKVRVRFDAEQFNPEDVAALMQRVGSQVGLLEGRPDSKESAGCGWGTFDLLNPDGTVAA